MMEPYQLSSHLQSVNLSVGIVAMPKDGVDPVLILRRSNLALQNARASGIGNWSVFDSRDGPRRRLSPMGRIRAAHRFRTRRLRPALSAAARPADRPYRRLRGADPLEPSRTRHDPADGVHPDRRGNRHDRPDRRMGAAQGLQRCPASAGRLLRRRQHLAGPVHDQGFRRHRARDDAGHRHQAVAAGAGSHRDGDDAGSRPRGRHPESSLPRWASRLPSTISAPAIPI